MINGAIGYDKMIEIKKNLAKVSFPTTFSFLQGHAGLRKAELSLLISPNGSGKSTIVRTMVMELLKSGKKVFIYLSEEQADYYLMPLYQCALFWSKGDEEGANQIMRNLFIESAFEKDKVRSVGGVLKKMKDAICTELIDCVFIDNFTASFFGSCSIKEQGDSVMFLKELAIGFDIPIILVAHTVKDFDVYNTKMRGDSVRGNATTANVGSYTYCVSTFFRGEKPRTFINVDKARYHGKAQKKYYELQYDNDLELFTEDKPVTEKEFEDAQKEVKQVKRINV